VGGLERTKEWEDAVRRLREHTPSPPADLPLFIAIEEAKTLAAEAKAKYEMHRKEHGC